jgi:hypothetical protein
MRHQRLHVFSLWASAVSPTGSKTALFHCAITGPLFLIAGIAFLLAGRSAMHLNTVLIWRLVLIGIAVAFLLEWRYAKPFCVLVGLSPYQGLVD